ncbi:MAG: serine/threonine protein kinase [Pseudomonadales bacterium]
MRNLLGEEIGPYKITEKLGRGGMADVYKAYHIDLEISRAIKVIRPEFVSSDDFRARFLREAQAVAALKHPNIVQIHDFGSHENTFYMVMEYVEGEDLKKLIRANGAIRPISEVLGIICKIARALHYAHSKDLLHRDIKPDNIMLDHDGSPILMDFGIAKLLTADTKLTQTGVGIGTPSYMSPEQAQANETLGAASDIYSLSIVLYEMLTGKVPFHADTPIAVILKVISDPIPLPSLIRSDISEPLQQVILKGTAKKSSSRYQTAEQFADVLQNLIDEVDVDTDLANASKGNADQETLVTPPPVFKEIGNDLKNNKPKKKRGKLLLGATIALAALIGSLYAYLKLAGNAETPPATAQSAPLQSHQPASPVTAQRNKPSTAASVAASEKPSAAAVESKQTTGLSSSVASSSVIAEYRETVNAGTSAEVILELSAGDALFLDVNKVTSTTDFLLVSSENSNTIFKSHASAGPFEITESGRYELQIQPRHGKQSNVDMEIWSLKPAVIAAGVLSAKTFTRGSTHAPGQTVSYFFDASSGTPLFFDVGESKSKTTTDFKLISPDRRDTVFSSYNDFGPITIDKTGRHELIVDPRGDGVVDFDIAIFELSPPSIDHGEIEFNRYYTNSTLIPGQTGHYEIQIDSGATVYFDFNKSSGTTDFTLLAPNGRDKIFKHHGDKGPLQISDGGRYTLLADPRGDKTTNYDFRLINLDPAIIQGGKVVLGIAASGQTELPGQLVQYTFDGTKGQTIKFSRLNASNPMDFTLIAPDGRTEVFRTYSKTAELELPQKGEYQLLADPRYDRTSEFEFIIE